MIEIFKTDINSKRKADEIRSNLEASFPGHTVNIDLEDCDKILRVEALSLHCGKIMEIVKNNGIAITILK